MSNSDQSKSTVASPDQGANAAILELQNIVKQLQCLVNVEKQEININSPSAALKARLTILRECYPNTWE